MDARTPGGEPGAIVQAPGEIVQAPGEIVRVDDLAPAASHRAACG